MEKVKARTFRCGVITLSDRGSRGERVDTSGPLVEEMLQAAGFVIAKSDMLPDQVEPIKALLQQWADEEHLDMIVTTGGTGVASTDVTPEATRAVIDREVPGLAEAMRMASLQKTIQAVWSRGIAGIRGNCLILNLPGSPKAVRENLAAVLPALAHGLEKLQGSTVDCGLTV